MDNLLTMAQPLIVQVIEVLVLGVLGFGIRFFHKKTGIQISEANQKILEKAAIKAVLAVEERAAHQKKQGKKMITPTAKKTLAIHLLAKAAPKLKTGDVGELINWAVAQVPGLGATGEQGGPTTV